MWRIAVVGYGHIGRAALEALREAPDMEIAGVVRRKAAPLEAAFAGIPVVERVEELGHVDAALLCTPSRSVPDVAPEYLKKGIATVDSYDVHTGVPELRRKLDEVAKAHQTAAVLSAGWDPGSDSVVRALLEALAPKGLTYTNFGPGMSMGHSVAVRAIDGVKDALSVTIPMGTGVHRRMVYVELQEGADIEAVSEKIKNDPYFVHDETHVQAVESVPALQDMGHGVLLERKGVSGITHSQRFQFEMTINNPALTAQVMVACARAALRQLPGAYTMIELPMIDLLPGEREGWIGKLV